MSKILRFLLLCCLATGFAQAQTNGSFEQDLTGWSNSGNIVVRSNSAASQATNGTKFIAFNVGQSTPNGTLFQTIPTAVGAAYTLAFDVGAFAAASAQRLQVSATGTSSLVSQISTVTGPGSNSTIWLPQSVSFTANSTSTVIRFTDVSATSLNVDLLLDNIRLTTNVPRTLTISSTPNTGVNIAVTPADSNGTTNGVTAFTRRYSSGSVVSLTAPATSGGLSFVKWQRNGTDFSTNRTASVTIDGDHTLTAVYGNVIETIVNGSFEAGFSGWIKTGSVDIQAELPFVASDGSKLAGFNGASATPNGALTQIIPTTPGTSYTVAFDLGLLSYNGNEQKLRVTVTGTGTNSLLAQTVSITGPGNGMAPWAPKIFTFVANSTTTSISFADNSTSTAGLDLLLDKVSVYTVSTVPLSPPVVANDSATIHPGQKVSVPVLANDTGNINPASIEIVTPPSSGTAAATANGKILYTRSGSGTAPDSFTYRVSGNGGVSSSATVSINVSSTLRIPTPALNVPLTPPPTAVEAVPAFPGMSFEDPIAFVSPPGDTKRLFVGELGGKIKVISDVTAASPTSAVVLDLVQTVTTPPRVPAESWNPGIDREDGLLGFAFHPNFANNGYLFVSYAIVKASDPTVWYQRLSRFTVPTVNIANPIPLIDPASEYILIEQRDRDGNHNGGDIHFGPDGYLYTTIGDEAAGNDYRNNSQRIDLNFFSSMLRIDVDKKPGNLEPNAHPNPAANALGYSSVNAIKRDEIPAGSGNFVARYSIPIDNPYVRVNQGGTWNGTFNGTAVSAANLPFVRSEFYAVGFRSPWRFSIDDTTGEIWLADVGQEKYEEVDLIVKGGNYGWAYREGAHAGVRTAPPGFTSIDPIYEYTHIGTAGDPQFKGNSVIGGVVYRGSRFTSLSGAYIFGDNVSGHIWALTKSGSVPTVQRIAGQSSLSTFGTDPSNGDVLVSDYSGGRIMRIITTTDPGTFPTTLSSTGLFADLTDLSPSPGLLPYAPNLTFWSDHAVKRRWFTIPDGTSKMAWTREGAWTYPTGQIWVKHFDLETVRGNPASPKKRIETRVLVKNNTGVYGVSYRWNDAGTEATLAPDGGEDLQVSLTVNGAPYTQRWSIPSRAQCITCHSPEAGHALSFNTRQLNLNNAIHGFAGNQIDLLKDAGYFSNAPDTTALLPRHVLPTDTNASTEEKVRSYLAVNCSYCHAGEAGTASTGWDGRPETLLENTGLINAIASGGDEDYKLIAPGDLDHSVVLQRIGETNGFGRMPPLGSNELDATGIGLITDWINQLGGSNTRPVAAADSYTVAENSPLAISTPGVLSNDTDAQNTALQAVLVSGTTHGVLTLSLNGGFTYTPSPDFSGIDSFTYRAYDGSLYSTNATVSIKVTSSRLLENGGFESGESGWRMSGNRAVADATPTLPAAEGLKHLVLAPGNTAPDAVISKTFSTLPGQAYTLDFSMGIVAPNNSELRLKVTISGNALLREQTESVFGNSLGNNVWTPKSFGFTADSSRTTVTFTDVSAGPSLADLLLDSIRVSGPAGAPNTVPLAAADSYSLNQNSPLVVPANGVLTNDSDADSDTLSAVLDAGPSNGTLTLATNGSFTYTPAPGYTGSDSFMYHANDTLSDSNVVTVSLSVAVINTAPVALAETYSTNQNTALVTNAAAGVLANDTDAQSNPLTAVLGTGPSNGTLSLSPNGSFTYTPATGFAGSDSFTYRANDGNLSSNLATVSISVNVVNTAPIAVADSYLTNQNTALVVAANAGVLSNDTDAQSNPLTALLNTGPTQGALLLNTNGSFTYTPATGYTGPDSFTYRANDGALDSNIITVSLAVNAPNAVILVNGSFESGFTGWTTTGNQTIQSAAPFAATAGTKLVGFNGGNTTPNGVLSQTFATSPGQSYTLAFDAGVLFYTSASQVLNVTVLGNTNRLNQTLTFTGSGSGPNSWFPQNFTFIADSSNTTLTFRDQSASTGAIDLILDNVRVNTVQAPVNTAPLAVADSYSAFQGTALVVAAAGVLSNDTDAQANPLTAVLSGGPSNGTLTLNANGGFTYTPGNGYTGPDSFTYRANDGSLDSNIVTVSISVNAVVAGGIVNGSFESGFTGWTVVGNQTIQSAAPFAATEGTKLVGFNGGNTTPNGVLSQTFATSPGQSYTLAFDAGVLFYTSAPQVMNVTVMGSTNRLNRTLTFTGSGSGPNSWFPQNFTFIADSTATTLIFRDQSASTSAIDLVLDNVRINTVQAPVNTAPLAVADSYSAFQGTALVVAAAGVLSNDTDAQANPLTAVLSGGPSNGTLTLNANGGFTYTPGNGYTGPDSFTYRANDGSLDSNIVTVSISVNAVVAGGIVNGSFESGFTGWTTAGNQSIQSTAPYVATRGTKLVNFNGGNTTPNGVLSQTFATTPGQSYTLAFDAGILFYTSAPQVMNITVVGSTNRLNRTLTITGSGSGPNRWLPQSFTFTADSASSTLTFRDQSTSTNAIDLLLDNVSIQGAVLPAALLSQPLTTSTSPDGDLGAASLSATSTPGEFQISMNVTTPGIYVLERSEDLSKWHAIKEKEVTEAGPLDFKDQPNALIPDQPKSKMFYRIGRKPMGSAPAN